MLKDVILLLQRALVLLGSASRTITEERVVWGRVNPSSSSFPPEDMDEGKKTTLVKDSFLGKATKRKEKEKALAKILGGRHCGGPGPSKCCRP